MDKTSKKMEYFNKRARLILDERKTPGQDAQIYSDLGDAFALISNRVFDLGIESAQRVCIVLNDEELNRIFEEVKISVK
jgi:hypothetical protein